MNDPGGHSQDPSCEPVAPFSDQKNTSCEELISAFPPAVKTAKLVDLSACFPSLSILTAWGRALLLRIPFLTVVN